MVVQTLHVLLKYQSDIEKATADLTATPVGRGRLVG